MSVVGVAGNGNSRCASPVHHEDSLWRLLAKFATGGNRILEPNSTPQELLGRRIRLIGLLRKPLQMQGFLFGRASPVHHEIREPAPNRRGKASSVIGLNRLVEPRLRPVGARAGELRKAFAYVAFTASKVAVLVFATAAIAAVARERAPRVDPVLATFSFASAHEKQRFCDGEDGPYIEIPAHHEGTQTGDPVSPGDAS